MSQAPATGFRRNLGQLSLLVGVNALVGGMVGQERAMVPLLARREFGLTAASAALSFIVAFGVVKPVANLVAGAMADRVGRKPVLVAGWLIGLPVPLIIMWAPTWGWVVFANALLGANQGLTWTTTLVMKTDLAGPGRRGLAVGLNEASGYLAVGLTALATGYLGSRFGLRPVPFYLGLAYAGLGLFLSTFLVRETGGRPRPERGVPVRSTREVLVETSFRHPTLSSCCQAGLVTNLGDAVAWGLFPLLFAAEGRSVAEIGVLAALYPATWGLGQLATGAISDALGRKRLVVAGMLVQAVALGWVAAAEGFAPWAGAAVLLGVGTAMAYPTLLAAVSDVAAPGWRASALGVYRLWRDAGFVVGALVGGALADLAGLRPAIWAAAGVTAASGVVAHIRMRETLLRGDAAG